MGSKSTRKEYSVWGTEGNVNKAIEEREKTNREEINANKETELMEWEVNLKKIEMQNAESMARIEKENEVNLKKIETDTEIALKQIEHELTADHKFELENKKIEESSKLWQAKMGMDHKERMEAIRVGHEQTMGAMNIRGEFALTALKKGGQKSFRMKNSALTFQFSNQQQKTRKWKPHNMLEFNNMEAIENENEENGPAVPDRIEGTLYLMINFIVDE